MSSSRPSTRSASRSRSSVGSVACGRRSSTRRSGFPERLEQLRGPGRATTLRTTRFVGCTRSSRTAGARSRSCGAGSVTDGPRVEFVPFGVDTENFRPDPSASAEDDVVSVGADPRRGLRSSSSTSRAACPDAIVSHRRVGRQCPDARPRCPRTSQLEVDVPFGTRPRVPARRARVVALPVRENTYSGATTTLLQAMACGKPVVVTRTAAIARGYHLEDGVNCRLVAPGDLAALEQAVTGVLDDPRSRPASACRAARRSSAI